MKFPVAIEVVDSHTEAEPTRCVIEGWPVPAGANISERRNTMAREQDHLRRAVVLEPRGHDAIVGAMLLPPDRPEAVAGIVFFNDVGYLGMCGHGLIGVTRTLAHLGRIESGTHSFDTPAGPVDVTLADHAITIRNVPSYLHHADVQVLVPGLGVLTGDVAWGGNWFFIVSVPSLRLELVNRAELLNASIAIRTALAAAGITGRGGELIDHIELVGPAVSPDADARNFVLCPGTTYDRSPCGTGTSAKLAVLYHHGQLQLGQRWRQESITGSMFTGWLEESEGVIRPHITGNAFVTARSTLLFDPRDPFIGGLA
jgi:proline racemase